MDYERNLQGLSKLFNYNFFRIPIMVSRLSYQSSTIYRNDIAKNLKTSCSRRRIVLASSYIFFFSQHLSNVCVKFKLEMSEGRVVPYSSCLSGRICPRSRFDSFINLSFLSMKAIRTIYSHNYIGV